MSTNTDLDDRVVAALSAIPGVRRLYRGPGVLLETYWIEYDRRGARRIHRAVERACSTLPISWLAGSEPVLVAEPRARLLWERPSLR
jgi:hypothetical protein